MSLQRTRGRGGQALIMVTLSLMFLFSVMGLAVDLGWCYYLKSRVQTAADAAATGAAVWAYNNFDTCSSGCGTTYTCAGVTPPTNSLQAGCLYATTDAPPTLGATMIENTSSSVSSGVTGNAPYIWIKATASISGPVNFLYLAGWHSATISASATAGVTTNTSSGCIYVLDQNADNDALSISGGGSLTASGCGVNVAASGSKAIDVTGNGVLTASNGGRINIKGSYSGSGITPTPTTGVSTSDPLSSLTKPTPGACTSAYSLSSGTGALGTTPGITDPYPVQGTYCGGINLSGGTLTLQPGVYILMGGGLTVSGGTINGTGVTFYLTGDSTHTNGPVTISGQGILNVSAPVSGTYRGILFFQDSTHSYATANTFLGSASGNMSGTFYFPTTNMTVSGGASTGTAAYQAYVVYKLTISGNASIQQDVSGGHYTGFGSYIAGLIQ